MIMNLYVAYNQLVFLRRPVVVDRRPSPLQCGFERHGRLSIKAATSSSFTSSGVEYSKPLSTVQKKKEREIAGIDQDELVDPKILADPDSCFCEFQGLQLRYKICDPESEPVAFVSFKVMKRLAKVSGSKFLSYDRLAFGLTSRVDNQDKQPLNPYSMAFSVLATLYFIDFLAADKAILVGHSAGCLVAAQTYFQASERVAAMTLVSPAIVAPSAKKVKENDQQDSSNSDNLKNPILNLFGIVLKFYRFIAQTIVHLLKGMVNRLIPYTRKLCLLSFAPLLP